jgi:enoyl-CoA hydratase/carnithine racemase
MSKAKELAAKIGSKSQYAVRLALKAINICDEVSESEGLNFEASLFALSCGTEDFKEGTSAFLEKRKAVFKNK